MLHDPSDMITYLRAETAKSARRLSRLRYDRKRCAVGLCVHHDSGRNFLFNQSREVLPVQFPEPILTRLMNAAVWKDHGVCAHAPGIGSKAGWQSFHFTPKRQKLRWKLQRQ